MMRKIILISLIDFCFACSQKVEQKVEFIEIRIGRYAVLEHAREVFVMRKIDKDWSAELLGDGSFANCRYQKVVQPKSTFEDLWHKLVSEGLLEIPEGEYTTNCCTDSDGYEVEISHQGKLKRFSFHIPDKIPIKEAKQIQNIGNIVSENFETPMFYADYSRKDIGDYLIKNCEEVKDNRKVF
jgi:hypothetical protein